MRPSRGGGEAPRPGSGLALAALTALAVLAPWPYGSVGSVALPTFVGVALAAAAIALAAAALHGGVALPAVPAWPLGAFVALALAQLVPLPSALHQWLAPGSALTWHPRDPLVAAVLGDGPRPVSIDPATTLRGAALVAGLGLLALASVPSLAGGRGARRALGAVALGGFALSAYAIWARARFGVLLFGRIGVPTLAPFGPFVNKNHFAGWTAMAALLAAGLAAGLAAEGRRQGRDWTVGGRAGPVVLALLAALAMALAVLASLSRGGAASLAAAGACLVALLLVRRGSVRPRTAVAAGSFALVLVLAVLALVPPSARERLRSSSGAEFRLATWRDALRLAAASPLVGHGLGAFHDAFPRAKRANGELRVEHAESEYLETLAETGLAGLGVALCGLVALLRAGAAPRGSGLHGGIARGAAAALVALAVHSFFDFDLRIPSNAAVAALAAAAAAAGAGLRLRPLGRARAAAVSAAALALLVATLVVPVRPGAPARDDVREAWAARAPEVRALRLERAEAALAAGLRLRPADAESWLMLAGVRAARGDQTSAAALARHAVSLDPQRANLLAAARALARAGGDSP